ncbi:MAG: hypothetical protein ACE5ER_03555 [Nitrospinaceae bacterium]
MSIVLVGILMPTVIIPFSGIKDTKIPEHVTSGTWLGFRQMEAIANRTSATLPPAGTYTCTQFQTGPPKVAEIDCSSPDYTFTFLVEDVAANSPDVGGAAPGFGAKVTLTISRVDGAISDFNLYEFF